jgi:hypothetical protein
LLLTECAGTSDEEDEDVWYVVTEYATDQRSAMDTVEIVDDIWQKAQEFIHRAGTHMAVGHVGTADDLYLFEKRMESKVSSKYICQHDLLCRCGAGIRVT